MNNKIIIIFTFIFLLVGSIFLSATELKYSNIDNQNVWMLYFDNPKDNSFDFKIENHSTSNLFHWQIIIDKKLIKEGNTAIPKGETKLIPVSLSDVDTSNKKIIVSVKSENIFKEIYKSF